MDAAGEDSLTYPNLSGRRPTISRIINATGDKELAKNVTGHRSDCVLTYNETTDKSLRVATAALTNSCGSVNEIISKEEIVIICPRPLPQKWMKLKIDANSKLI